MTAADATPRRVALSMMVSLDGYYARPGSGWETIDWHRADPEWAEFSVETLRAAGTLLFGRITYEGFASYWPNLTSDVARLLNRAEKVVFSSQPLSVHWNNSRLASGYGDIDALRRSGRGDILIFGSGTLADRLIRARQIDEFRLAINPVFLGAGLPLFRPGQPSLDLTLTATRRFSSGIVLNTYVPATGSAH